jgi:hypothetical protein
MNPNNLVKCWMGMMAKRQFLSAHLFITTGILAFAMAAFFPPEGHSATLTLLTSRPATGDTVDWGQLGTPNLTITTPQNFTSTGGTTGTVDLNGTGFLVEQCCIGIVGTFDGDFAPGNIVLATHQAPLTINFNTPVQSVGVQIQDNRIGDQFIAEIMAYSGDKLLGVFTENGFSGDVGDNSNIFLGVQDATADITSVIFLTFVGDPPTVPYTSNGVAINQMTISAPPCRRRNGLSGCSK